jgi:hypothetical protein
LPLQDRPQIPICCDTNPFTNKINPHLLQFSGRSPDSSIDSTPPGPGFSVIPRVLVQNRLTARNSKAVPAIAFAAFFNSQYSTFHFH